MLTGAELLAKVKDLGDGANRYGHGVWLCLPEEGRFQSCELHQVLRGPAQRQGVDLGGGSAGVGSGRKLSYKAVVQGNGNLLVGKAYTGCLTFSLVMNSQSNFPRKV